MTWNIIPVKPTLKIQIIHVVVGFIFNEITGLGSLWVTSNYIIQNLERIVFPIEPAAGSLGLVIKITDESRAWNQTWPVVEHCVCYSSSLCTLYGEEQCTCLAVTFENISLLDI